MRYVTSWALCVASWQADFENTCMVLVGMIADCILLGPELIFVTGLVKFLLL